MLGQLKVEPTFTQGCGSDADEYVDVTGDSLEESMVFAVGFTRSGESCFEGLANEWNLPPIATTGPTGFARMFVHHYNVSSIPSGSFDLDGNPLMSQTVELMHMAVPVISDEGDVLPSAIAKHPLGGVVICGQVTKGRARVDGGAQLSSSAGQGEGLSADAFSIRYDEDLNVLWGWQLGNNALDEYCADLAISPAGGSADTVGDVVLALTQTSNVGQTIMLVQRDSVIGSEDWTYTEGLPNVHNVVANIEFSAVTPSDFFTTGWSSDIGTDEDPPIKGFVRRFRQSPNPRIVPSKVWENNDLLDGSLKGSITDIDVGPDDELFVTASLYLDDPSDRDIIIFLFSKESAVGEGDVECSFKFDGSRGVDQALQADLLEASNGELSLVVVGYTTGSIAGIVNAGGQDLLIIRYPTKCSSGERTVWIYGSPEDDLLSGLVALRGAVKSIVSVGRTSGVMSEDGRRRLQTAGSTSEDSFLITAGDPNTEASNGSTVVQSSKQKMSLGEILAIFFAATVTVIVSVVIFFLWRERRRREDAQKSSVAREGGSSTYGVPADIFLKQDKTPSVFERPEGSSGTLVLGPESSSFQDYHIIAKDIRIMGKLGEGFYGTVFKGRWHGQWVAVKKLKHATGQKELVNEIMLLNRLRHPNVTFFYGCTPPPEMLIVSELLWGSLFRLLHLEKEDPHIPMSDHTCFRIGKDIARGLDYIHSRNIVHRDISSSNVLLTGSKAELEAMAESANLNPLAKITDFGLSRNLDAGQTQAAGNLNYLAPEMFRGEAASQKTDVYSFSLLLWEIYNGKVPFSDQQSPQLAAFRAACENLRPPITDAVPTGIALLLQDCWRENCEERPSFDGVLTAMDELERQWNVAETPTAAELSANSYFNAEDLDQEPLRTEDQGVGYEGFDLAALQHGESVRSTLMTSSSSRFPRIGDVTDTSYMSTFFGATQEGQQTVSFVSYASIRNLGQVKGYDQFNVTSPGHTEPPSGLSAAYATPENAGPETDAPGSGGMEAAQDIKAADGGQGLV